MAREQGGSDLGTVIVAGAIGAAVGAVVALMLAPKAGTEFRAELGEKTREYAEKAKEKVSEVAEIARERVAELGQATDQDADDAAAAKAAREAEATEEA